MEMDFDGNTIKMERVLSSIDKLVIKFTGILKKQNIDYVIISGYIPILFGRSRETEDVDIFIEELDNERFARMWSKLENSGFECLNAPTPGEAMEKYLQNMLAVRFAVKGTFIPNFEIKLPKTYLNMYSLRNKIAVNLNNKTIWTSKMELQIAYKLFLGSDKDMEDAAYLWHIFKEYIDKELFAEFTKRLKVESKVKELE